MRTEKSVLFLCVGTSELSGTFEALAKIFDFAAGLVDRFESDCLL